MADIRIGAVGRPHGLRGEVALNDCPLTADELRSVGTVTWRGRDGATRELAIERVRPASRLLVHFVGVDSLEAARALGLGELFVDAERLPDPGPGVAYAFQIVGLDVQTDDGRRLGVLESVVPTGANLVYIVQGEREWLIPATADVVRKVDLERRVITVSLPPGLEDI